MLDFGKCDPEHFYDLEYKRCKLLERVDARIEFDEKASSCFSAIENTGLFLGKKNQYLRLLKSLGHDPEIRSKKELILT